MEAKSVAMPAPGNDDVYVDVAEYGTAGRSAWMDIDWSAFTHKALIDGRTVNYVEYGDRALPTVVLIHGLAASWQCWLENIPALAEAFHVVAIDLPGFGESEMPREKISIPGYARCVSELLDHLDLVIASVIGNSMGGLTALRFALDYPDRTDRLIVVSPAGHSSVAISAAVRRAAVAISPALRNLSYANKAIASRPALRKIAMYGICSHADQLSPDIVLQMMGFSRKPGLPDALEALLLHDLRSELPNISAPTMVLWGRDDGLIGSGDAHRIGDKIPNARKVILNDTSHVAMIERPAWFNANARDFLLSS